MAKFHRRMRDQVQGLVTSEPVAAVVLLSTVTGHGPHVGGTSGSVSYNAAEDYVRRNQLDPAFWLERRIGGFGLVVALGDRYVHVIRSQGNMRSGQVEYAFASERAETTLRHDAGASIPVAATRLLHFGLLSGQFIVGSAPLGRMATNEMNDVEHFLDSWGPTATNLER